MRKIATLLFAAMFAGQAWAQTTFTKDKLEYTVTGTNTVSATAADTDIDGDFEIPSTVENDGVTYNVTSIGEQGLAYSGCKSIIIPNSVTTIGDQAFKWCSNLESVTFSSSVTTIGNNIFKSCAKIAAVNVAAGNAAFASDGGVLFNSDNTTLIYCPIAKSGAYTIPNSVTTIGDFAFASCKELTSITIQNSVTTIGASAFEYCERLTAITIPNSVTNIGNEAFSNCENLASVTMSNAITSISEKMFLGCGLKSFEIPSGVTSIEEMAFYACGELTSLIISNTVTTIKTSSIRRCRKLESIVIPKTVTTIVAFAFYENDLLTIYCEAEPTPEGWDSSWNLDENNVVWGYDPNAKTWKVTVSANNASYGTVSGGGTVKDGANVTITASPASGYKFVKWSNNLTSASATITVTSDTTLVAYFEAISSPKTWTVTLSANNALYGSVSGGGTYADGSIITITATPATGYRFVKWSNGLTATIATITVTSDTTLVSEFAEIGEVSTLHYEIIDNSTVKVVKSDDYKELTEIVIPKTVEIDGKTYTVTSIDHEAFYFCTQMVSVTIPNTITSIGSSAFRGCRKMENVTIPNSVNSLGLDVFYGCVSLTGINVESGNNSFSSENGVVFSKDKKTLVCYPHGKKDATYSIPESVTIIGNESFSGSNLTSVIIPNSVTIICDRAFFLCNSLKTIDIPNGVTTIEDNAFSSCGGLMTVSISESVTDIANNVFEYSSKLTEINVAEGNTKYSSENGILFSKDKKTILRYPVGKTATMYSIPESVTTIGEIAFKDCNKLSAVTIPNSVKAIGESAFRSCSGLKSIIIPESVTSIGNSVFEGCTSLSSVTIPNTITTIPFYGFRACRNLTTISLPNTITCVESYAFEECDKLEFYEYDNALYLGNSENHYFALINAKSTDITACEINSNCKVIAGRAFKDCNSLTTITVPNSVVGIGSGAFTGCSSLESMTLPFVGDKRHALTDAWQYPFGYIFGYENYDGGYKTSPYFYYRDNASSIGSTFFIPASLKSVTLTDCDYIQSNAFGDCDNLTSITIPTTVTQIESGAMPKGENLTIYCSLKSAPRGWVSGWNPYNRPVVWGNVDVVDANNIDGDFAYRIIDATNAEIIDYVGAETEIVIPSTITKNSVKYTVTRIGDNAFNSYVEMKSVTIPSTVTSIGNRAFANCNNLTSVLIPNSVTTIGSCVFEYCRNLKSIEIPNSVTTIGNTVFLDCDNLISVEIPNSITGISNMMFCYCDNLSMVTIPDVVTSIGRSAFYGCKSLTSVNIPNSVSYIGEWAFSSSGLTYVAIPNSVTRIDGWAFDSCDSLKAITIPNSVTAMDWLVFQDCPNTTIYCEPASKPDGWSDDWNSDNCPVVWGVDIKAIFYLSVVPNSYEYGGVKGGGVNIGSSTASKISATPAVGYHFSSWSDGNTDNPRTITVASDTSFIAIFEEHTIATDAAVAATCTESGKTEGSHCSVCGEVLVAQKEIPALGHKFVNYIYNNDATTESDGTETATCKHGCGETDTRVAEGTRLTTAVSESVADNLVVYAHDNKIVVENATDEISVYDAMGKLICRDAIHRVRAEITVNTPGVYIVKTGSTVKRVVVN